MTSRPPRRRRRTPLPHEWLRHLEETPGAYAALLQEAHGSLAIAAHRVALARCQSWHQATDVPSRTELYAAAHVVAIKAGWAARIPTIDSLAMDCEAAGLLVL